MSNKWSEGYKPEVGPNLEGPRRCVVVEVEETTSKSSSLPMFVITVMPNGSRAKVKYYIVKNEYFNRNITSFFDSFGIERGDFNYVGWVGAMGAANFGTDENGYLKVKWFITPDKARDLPEWEGQAPERQSITEFIDVTDDEDLPL